VSRRYGSGAPQNETINVGAGDDIEVVLDFGVSSAPSFTSMSIVAFYTPNSTSGIVECSNLVQASVTVTGPEFSYNGTTTTSWDNPLMLTVEPGEYLVSATYESVTQYSTLNVTSTGGAVWFNFGSSPWLPPP
jgi:hypothetical protein